MYTGQNNSLILVIYRTKPIKCLEMRAKIILSNIFSNNSEEILFKAPFHVLNRNVLHIIITYTFSNFILAFYPNFPTFPSILPTILDARMP